RPGSARDTVRWPSAPRVGEAKEHSFPRRRSPPPAGGGERRRGKECSAAKAGTRAKVGMRPAAWSVRAAKKDTSWDLTAVLIDGGEPKPGLFLVTHGGLYEGSAVCNDGDPALLRGERAWSADEGARSRGEGGDARGRLQELQGPDVGEDPPRPRREFTRD